MIVFILGMLDIFGGVILLISPNIFLSIIMKSVGIILVIKGVWSVISDIKFLLKTR